MSSAFFFNLNQSKILSSGNGFKEKKEALENILSKGENAGNQYFRLFPQCFLSCYRHISSFEPLQDCLSLCRTANAFILDLSLFSPCSKDLNVDLNDCANFEITWIFKMTDFFFNPVLNPSNGHRDKSSHNVNLRSK